MPIELPTAENPVAVVEGDCLDVLRGLPDGCVDAVVADPPYNQRIAEWDDIPDYADWCRRWVAEASRVLSPSGAFWCFHGDPVVLGEISRDIEAGGRKRVSFITLDKSRWTLAKRYRNSGSKSFVGCAEYAVYHRRDVFAEEVRDARRRHGLKRSEFDAMVAPSRKPTGLCYRWEHGERVPQPAEVERIRERFGVRLTLPYFKNRAKRSCVWRFPVPEQVGHPTAKPLPVVRRIVRATVPPDGTILDPFGGSGTTALAAVAEWRRCVMVERDPTYCGIARQRTADALGRPLVGADGSVTRPARPSLFGSVESA